MTDVTVTMTEDEVQYLLNSMDTHVKTHGLGVATTGVIILSKLRAAANVPSGPAVQSTEEPESDK